MFGIPILIGALRSVVSGRQYPQLRCFKAGWVEHSGCIFCLHSAVTEQMFEATMPPITLRRSLDAELRLAPTSSTTSAQLTVPRLPAPLVLPPLQPPRLPPHPPAKKAIHEIATDQQIAATPPGTLTHRHYVCPSLQKERAKYDPKPRLPVCVAN